MRTFYLVLISVLVSHCTTTSTTAGEIEGVVVMVGSLPNARPVIEPNGPKSQHEVCPSDEQTYLRRFGGTFVKATGEWGEHPVTKERCFHLKSFEVVQLIKGRPSFSGTLIKSSDGLTSLDTTDGRKMVLEHPSKGVSALTGKKVIMDLLPSDKTTAGGKDPLWKVVSYMEVPAR